MLKIVNNGSRWAGEAPAPLEELFAVLAERPLDRTFEAFGNFITGECRGCVPVGFDPDGSQVYKDIGPIYPEAPTAVRFWGNFYDYSHVFQVDTDEPEIITRLTTAIRANQQRPDYLSQPHPRHERKLRVIPA